MKQTSLSPEFDASTGAPAKPFVKWVGGKRSLLRELLPRAPKDFRCYYEPFLGGGAFFFALLNNKLLNITGGGRGAFLSDINPDLVSAWQVIRDDVEALIELLKDHAQDHNRDYYYSLRARHLLDDRIERAARLIYLNKTCFNGLWRVNSKGQFNVPMGSYQNPAICDEAALRSCHSALQGVDIQRRDFRALAAGEDDFVYFDPPYQPLDATSFTRYAIDDFGIAEQEALRDLCLALHERGAKFMISNSNTKYIRDLYSANVFALHEVKAPRMVNSRASERGAVNELIITIH